MRIRAALLVCIVMVLRFPLAQANDHYTNEQSTLGNSYSRAIENSASEEIDLFFPCESVYISPNDLFFDGHVIYVRLHDGYITTSAIYSDAKGLYFKDFKRQGNCAKGQWHCENCDTCNENYLIWCKTCHKR